MFQYSIFLLKKEGDFQSGRPGRSFSPSSRTIYLE